MGQKVNPKILRLGSLYNWSSRWFADKGYKETLLDDINLRKAILERLKNAGVSEVQIERSINSMKLIIYVARPGMVIGRGGSGLEEMKEFVYKTLKISKNSKTAPKVDIRIEPVKEPNLDAFLIAKNIAEQLAKRIPHRRVMTKTLERMMESGAKGARIVLSGRVGGAEIGRVEKLQRGTLPLSTIRANISFAHVPALTKKGYVGVKVWINRSEIK